MAETNNKCSSRNVVVFGQTGAGKSSIINMLAGSRVAEESANASGCTRYNQPSSVSHKDDTYTFWDTAGLNESELGTVPHQTAMQNLQAIIKERNPNLLIYCIRDRLVNIIRDNYNSIYAEKIPMVLVVTGLEANVDMDGWWNENEKTIKKMKMSFVGHACITSWKGKNDIYLKEYEQSITKLWELVSGHCKTTLPGPVHNIILFGEAGAGKSSLVNMIVGKDVAKVSSSAEGCTFKSEAYEATIDDTSFNIYDTAGLNEGDQGRVPHWEAIKGLYTLIRQLDGVSLLVCCMRGRFKENTPFNWILFNKVICGEKVPIIAIVTGLETCDDPEEWWRSGDNKSAFKTNGMRPKAVGCVVSYIGRQHEYANIYDKSQSKLRRLIIENHLREPWSEEKDQWFSHIYENAFLTRLCFPSNSRLDYSTRMRDLTSELIKDSDMERDETEKLKTTLLTAEKEFRKRGHSKRNII